MKVINFLNFLKHGLSSLTDEELMILVKDNEDEMAFRQIYETYHKRLFFYVKGLVKKTQIAEEVTHDVFYKIWNKRESYKSGSSFKAWLWTIARNSAFDYLRKRAESSLDEFEAWEESTATKELGPFEEIVKKSQSELVQKSLLKLL